MESVAFKMLMKRGGRDDKTRELQVGLDRRQGCSRSPGAGSMGESKGWGCDWLGEGHRETRCIRGRDGHMQEQGSQIGREACWAWAAGRGSAVIQG